MIPLNQRSNYCAIWLIVLVFVTLIGCQEQNSQIAPKTTPLATTYSPGVVLLRYRTGSGSTEQRELGFLQTLQSEYPDLNILSAGEYAGTTPESSKEMMQKVLQNYGALVTGVFAVCEPNTDGVLRALEEEGLTGKVRFVGFDPDPATIAALDQGKIDGIVLQDPVQMGYVAVQTMIAYLEGDAIETRISTGEYLATPDNMEDAALQPMLRPKRFSGDHFIPEEKKYTIAVVTKGRTHGFWESVRAGAEKAARETGNVEIRFQAPLLESDLDGQISLINELVEQKINGLCLVPIDGHALVRVVKDAKEKGVPTLVFDSNLYDDDLVKIGYVATDNYEGGAIAARRLAEVLGHKAAKSESAAPEPTTDSDELSTAIEKSP